MLFLVKLYIIAHIRDLGVVVAGSFGGLFAGMGFFEHLCGMIYYYGI